MGSATDRGRTVVLRIGREEVLIQLLWDQAPGICSKLWESLPLETTAHLAKVCNHELIFMLPFVAERENLQPVQPGSVGWWDVRSAVNIWFDDPGPNGPLGPTALIGRVVANLEGLAREALKVWARPGLRIRLEKKS